MAAIPTVLAWDCEQRLFTPAAVSRLRSPPSSSTSSPPAAAAAREATVATLAPDQKKYMRPNRRFFFCRRQLRLWPHRQHEPRAARRTRLSFYRGDTCDFGFPVMNRPHGVAQLLAKMGRGEVPQIVEESHPQHGVVRAFCFFVQPGFLFYRTTSSSRRRTASSPRQLCASFYRASFFV